MLGTGLSSWKRDDLLTIVFQMRENGDTLVKAGPGCASNNKFIMTWETAKRAADYVLSDEFEQCSGLVIEFTEVIDYAEINLMDRISDYFKSKMEEKNQKLYFRLHSGWEEFQIEEVWRYLRKNERNTEVEIILDNFLDVKDSVICLWEKGVAEVFVHMEAEEESEEAQIFEKQLKELADYAMENQLFRRCRCNYFEEEISGCLWERNAAAGDFRNRGMMVVPSGDIYSFVRDIGCSHEKREKCLAGNVEAGVDPERIRPFCVMPEYEMDIREEKLRMARLRANEYYFAQLWSRYRIRREKSPKLQRMYIPLEDCNIFWHYDRYGVLSGTILADDMLEKPLKYCEENAVEAVLIHPSEELLELENPRLHRMRSIHIVAQVYYEEAKIRYENVIPGLEQDAAETEERFVF